VVYWWRMSGDLVAFGVINLYCDTLYCVC